MKARNGFRYAGFGLMGIAGMILFTFVVMWLWNWLVPELFNGPVLGYWQTLGLLVLSKILFSGIGGGHSRSSRRRSSQLWQWRLVYMPKSRWRQKYEEKMKEKETVGESNPPAASI